MARHPGPGVADDAKRTHTSCENRCDLQVALLRAPRCGSRSGRAAVRSAVTHPRPLSPRSARKEGGDCFTHPPPRFPPTVHPCQVGVFVLRKRGPLAGQWTWHKKATYRGGVSIPSSGGRLFVSTGLRQRTVCQACGAACRVAPTEAMFHEGRGVREHWLWLVKILCPPCRAAQLDFWRSSK